MRVALVGFGAVGRRVAALLAADDAVETLTVLHRDPRTVRSDVARLGGRVELRRGSVDDLPDADVTVMAAPGGNRRAAKVAIRRGSHLVSCSDDPDEVRALLGWDRAARAAGVSIVAGAAMAPGLTCVLAAHLRERFDTVDEVHVASVGTGGPACARRHHAALATLSLDWEDGEWRRRPGGSGRELVWFPEPVGGADCYRASLPDALLLVPAFPGCRRITSRLEATRRDRMTSWLPMLRPPHPEGLVGAARVEVRGWVDERAETSIVGSAVPPAVAASAVAALAAVWSAQGRLARTGSGGLAEMVGAPGLFLKEASARGIRVSVFEGQPATG